MTTEPTAQAKMRERGEPAKHLFAWGTVAAGLWLVALALITAFLEPLRTVAVFGPAHHVVAALEGTDMRIRSAGTGYLVVEGDTPGFVRRLYARGALLVLPSRPAGCIRSGVM